MDRRRPEDHPTEGGAQGVAGGRLGRRIGAGVFWILALYLIVVAFYSIVPQVFAESSAPSGVAGGGQCREALGGLRDALVDGLADHVRSGVRGDPDRAWLARWDARFAQMEPGCRGPKLEEAVSLLGRLRQRVGRHAVRFDRDVAPALRRLETLLGPAPSPSGDRTPPSSNSPSPNEASP